MLLVATLPAIAAGVLLGVVTFAGARPLIDLMGEEAGGDVLPMVRVIAAFVPVAVAYEVLLAATRALDDLASTLVIDRIVRPVVQLVAILPVLAGASLPVVAAAWCAPFAVRACSSRRAGCGACCRPRRRPRSCRATARSPASSGATPGRAASRASSRRSSSAST